MNSWQIIDKYKNLPASRGTCNEFLNALKKCVEVKDSVGYNPSHDEDCKTFRTTYLTCLKNAGYLINER